MAEDVRQMSVDAGNGNGDNSNNNNEDVLQVEDTTMRDLFHGYCRGI